MKQFIVKYWKKMSVEDALFIFSMAIWLMIAGLIVLSVGIIVLFVRNDAFIHDISE